MPLGGSERERLGSPGGSISPAGKEQSSLAALSCLCALDTRHSLHLHHAAIPEEPRRDSTDGHFLLLGCFLFFSSVLERQIPSSQFPTRAEKMIGVALVLVEVQRRV